MVSIPLGTSRSVDTLRPRSVLVLGAEAGCLLLVEGLALHLRTGVARMKTPNFSVVLLRSDWEHVSAYPKRL